MDWHHSWSSWSSWSRLNACLSLQGMLPACVIDASQLLAVSPHTPTQQMNADSLSPFTGLGSSYERRRPPSWSAIRHLCPAEGPGPF